MTKVDLIRYFAEAGRLWERRTGGLAPHHVRQALAHIDAADGPPSVDELAKLCGLSRFHFMRAFKATLGVSPGEYVSRARIARAKELLIEGEMPLSAIAKQVGYTSASAFSAAFRRATGRAPGAYRVAVRS